MFQRRNSTTSRLSSSIVCCQIRFRTHQSLAPGSQNRSHWCYRWWCGLHRDRGVLSVLARWHAGSGAMATSFQELGGSPATVYHRPPKRVGLCVRLPAVGSHIGGGVRCIGLSCMGMALHRYSVGCRWVSGCKTLATMLVYQPS